MRSQVPQLETAVATSPGAKTGARNPFITPFYFGISHGILIYLGNFIALRKNILKIHLIKYLSPTLFTILAITKLI